MIDKLLSLDEAYDKACRYCARSERSERDVRQKFYSWRVAPEHQDKIIAQLYANRYLDEARFTLAFARDKHRFSGWGRQRIARELRMRGISSATIEEAFREVFEEFDEEEQLLDVLSRKLRSLKASDPLRKRFEQMMRFGLYRGFDYEAVRRITEKLLKANIEDDELLDD